MPETHPIAVLFVEDDEDVRMAHAQSLELAGFTVHAFGSVAAASAMVVPEQPLVVVTDVQLPGTSGLQWQQALHQLDPELPVILVTGHGDIAMAVNAMRAGAYDFIEKPCSAETLATVVRRAADRRQLQLEVLALRRELSAVQGIEAALIGRSAQMQRVRQRVRELASAPADVVIYGETGTGKDLVARCLHEQGSRSKRHFVPVNCGGLPETLVDSELFGHEPGAFTGATRRRIGKFEHAHGGTLFLDEIESMPLAVQTKLLRALQERSIERLGSNQPVPVDCRVVAASKDDLRTLADQGKFRADLYYRLGVAFIELPPLRERREDIPLLFEHLVLAAARRFERAAPAVSGAVLTTLMAHTWPGNVRELRNVADRFVLGLLEGELARSLGRESPPLGLGQQLDAVERTLITEALKAHHGEVVPTARALEISRQTLYEKLKRHGLDLAPFRDPV